MARQGSSNMASGGATGARIEILDDLIESGTLVAARQDPTECMTLIGHLAGVDGTGRVLFRPEAGGEVLPVAIGVAVSDGVIVRAARIGQRAVVQRTSDQPARFVLTALVRERISNEARDAEPGRLEVSLDGETVALSATHRIELRCGKSSLVLTKDGRVVLKGTHVVSRSTGANKIKGASVALN